MALPLTVKTETVLANQSRILPSTAIDREIDDQLSEADLLTLIELPEEQREVEMTTTSKGLETPEGSKSIMKITTLPIIDVDHACLTKTSTEVLLQAQRSHMMNGRGTLTTSVLELAVARLTVQIVEKSMVVLGMVEKMQTGINLGLKPTDSLMAMVTCEAGM
jgi:hypothetical protein